MDEADVIELIKEKIQIGTTRTAILQHLSQHGIHWSLSTLKRRMAKWELKYHTDVNPTDVVRAVRNEQRGPRRNAGIRMMQLRLRTGHNLLVTREQTSNVMTLIRGTTARLNGKLRRRQYRSEGSNSVWSIDGHDKIKEFGLAIHGCVDAFSRKIMWMEVYSTNNNPYVTAKYFMECIREQAVIPQRIRVDRGTENVIICQCQMYLRRSHTDRFSAQNSVIWGPSPLNQPIENQWSQFMEHFELYWIEELQGIKHDDLWQNGDNVDRWCMLYVYMPVLKRQVSEYVRDFNNHRIRKQRGQYRPHGIVNDMYEIPTAFGGNQCGLPLRREDIIEIDSRFHTNIPVTDYIPQCVRRAADNWLGNLHIDKDNARDTYEDLRNYFQSRI